MEQKQVEEANHGMYLNQHLKDQLIPYKIIGLTEKNYTAYLEKIILHQGEWIKDPKRILLSVNYSKKFDCWHHPETDTYFYLSEEPIQLAIVEN